MKRANSGTMIVGIIFFIIGAIFATIGVVVYNNETNFKESALITDATIVDIRAVVDSDGETSYDVYVEYYVDSVLYDGKLNYYNSTMEHGDLVKIYYDPNNPEKFVGDGSTSVLIIMIIIGGIFSILGIGFIIFNIKSKIKRNKILKYNFIIQANIVNCVLNENILINGVHPHNLIATIMSPYDGLTYTFKSESIMKDLTPIIQAYSINTVPVYVNPQNYKEYYVDIDYFKRYF